MKKTNISLILFILFGLVYNNIALSWDNNTTHMQLSEYAAMNSILDKNKGDYLINIGFGDALDTRVKWGIEQTFAKWFRDGANFEDAGTTTEMLCGTARSYNHFHNPLKPWAIAGLNDIVINLCPPFPLAPPWLHATGESSLLWAQDGANQNNFNERDWSWQTVRTFYYTALTHVTEVGRQAYFAQTFKGLGHQMHHIQDAAQPDHVRNDAHPVDGGGFMSGLETWTKRNPNIITCLLRQHASLPPDVLSACQQYGISESVNIANYFPTISTDSSAYSLDSSYSGRNLTPAALFIDTDQYTGSNPSASLSQGLAEYTNANFFSDDTIFSAERFATDDRHYFPYPKKTSTNQSEWPETIIAEDLVVDQTFYVNKTADGEIVDHFVKPSYFTNPIVDSLGDNNMLYHRTFYRDDKCHADYAKLLLPRAVGYSAALLNYFFRGSIDITLPDSGFYSSATPNSGGFTTIKVLALNATENNEDMLNGSIELVVKYQPTEDAAFVYQVVSEATGTRTIPSDEPIELTFNLGRVVPFTATDIYLQVVYHGRLGNEDGAVAVGFKDISEPTPIDIYNAMDKICINGSWYDAGSQAARDEADNLGNQNGIADDGDIYPHYLKAVYIKLSPSENPQWASDTVYDFVTPAISTAAFLRPGYILTEVQPEGIPDFYYSLYGVPEIINLGDPWGHEGIIYQVPGIAVQNQVEQVEDPALCDGATSCRQKSTYYSFRGVQMWWGAGFIFTNAPYPTGSQCSIDLL